MPHKKKNQSENEQKKSIYGTAANDGKTGNKNQFITETHESGGEEKRLKKRKMNPWEGERE